MRLTCGRGVLGFIVVIGTSLSQAYGANVQVHLSIASDKKEFKVSEPIPLELRFRSDEPTQQDV